MFGHEDSRVIARAECDMCMGNKNARLLQIVVFPIDEYPMDKMVQITGPHNYGVECHWAAEGGDEFKGT